MIGLGLALVSDAGCRDAPTPAPVPERDTKPRQVDPAQQAERREELDAMMRRCREGVTCPPVGSAARTACEQVAAQPVDGALLSGLAAEDDEQVAAARRYFQDRMQAHEEAARPGGVTQTDDLADAAAAARRELAQAEDAAEARAAVMQHLKELGRFQRWCAVGEVDPAAP